MRRVGLLVLDGALTSGLGAITDMFALSNRFIRRQYADREERGLTIETRLLSLTGAPCRTAAGKRLEIEGSTADRQIYDLVYIAAFDVADDETLAERTETCGPVCDWLRTQRENGAVIAASGGAVLLLAEAGLLDRKPIAAPWWLEASLKQRFPHLEIDNGLKLSDNGGILCSAGMNGDTPLAIRLVERLLSRNVANWIAKQTSIDRDEREPDPQIVHSPIALCDDPTVSRAQHWLQERFSEKPLIPDLAAFLAISERTLTRRFEKSLGISPLAYLQALRIEVAKGMLARSDQTIERIAYLVSYSDPKFFKKVFRDVTGLSPSAYRRKARAEDNPQSQESAKVSTISGPART